MKKLFSLIALMFFAFVLVGCGSGTTEATVPEKDIIALSLTSMDNPLMVAFNDVFNARFGSTFNVQVASADNNPNTQSTQIQNFILMGAKIIFCMPVETSSLIPVLEDAREAGVLIMVAGTEPGESARDAVAKMDQYLAGEYEALMVKEWVAVNYPAAANNSIDAALLVSTINQDSINRSNGVAMVFEPFLKNVDGDYIDLLGNVVTEANAIANPVYVPQLRKVAETEATMFQPGQVATENLFTTYPNLKIVLCYDSDAASGASQAIMDHLNGASSSGYASFGVGMFGPEGDTLKASATGDGTLRGCVAFGGGDLVGNMADIVNLMVTGGEYPHVTWDALATVTANAEGTLAIVQRPSSGIVSETPLAN